MTNFQSIHHAINKPNKNSNLHDHMYTTQLICLRVNVFLHIKENKNKRINSSKPLHNSTNYHQLHHIETDILELKSQLNTMHINILNSMHIRSLIPRNFFITSMHISSKIHCIIQFLREKNKLPQHFLHIS